MENKRKSIVIAVDGSSHSQAAVDWAIKNYLNPTIHDAVFLLHVRPVVDVFSPAIVDLLPHQSVTKMDNQVSEGRNIGGEYSETHRGYSSNLCLKERNASHALINHFMSQIHSSLPGISVKGYSITGDNAGYEICRECKELGADSLVMGSRGLGLLKRIVLGSVSHFCLHNAHCPVILCKSHPQHHSLSS